MNRTLRRLAVPLCLTTACSPSGQAVSWAPVQDAASVAQQVATAVGARDALGKKLLAELQAAMASGGPAAGIEVCASRAPVLAKDVAREHGVKIGRTSHRLRNPANAPPDWAEALVAAHADTGDKKAEPRLFRSSAGALGAVYPIHLGAQCIVCHGAKENLADPVKTALAARYQKDAATGFAPGDLRGWFWVEVEAP